MATSTRARASGILSLCLVLLSLLAPAAQAAPLEAQWSSQVPATIGSNSCQPDVDTACANLNGNVGNVGNVGNDSCNGEDACFFQDGNVGNDSCVGFSACDSHTGVIGNGSCNGFGGL
jgi:hypothetical protein